MRCWLDFYGCFYFLTAPLEGPGIGGASVERRSETPTCCRVCSVGASGSVNAPKARVPLAEQEEREVRSYTREWGRPQGHSPKTERSGEVASEP